MKELVAFQTEAEEAFGKLGLSKDAKFVGFCIKGSDVYFLYKISSLTRASLWSEAANVWENITSSNNE